MAASSNGGGTKMMTNADIDDYDESQLETDGSSSTGTSEDLNRDSSDYGDDQPQSAEKAEELEETMTNFAEQMEEERQQIIQEQRVHLEKITIPVLNKSTDNKPSRELHSVDTEHNLEMRTPLHHVRNIDHEDLHSRPSSRHVIFNSEEGGLQNDHTWKAASTINNQVVHVEETIQKKDYSCSSQEVFTMSSLTPSPTPSPLPSTTSAFPHSPSVIESLITNGQAQKHVVKVRPLEDADQEEQPAYKFLTESPIEKEIRVLMEREAELRRDKGLPPIATTGTADMKALTPNSTINRRNTGTTVDDEVDSAADDVFLEADDLGQTRLDTNNNNNGQPFRAVDNFARKPDGDFRRDNNGKGMMARFIASRGKLVPDHKPTFQRRSTEQRSFGQHFSPMAAPRSDAEDAAASTAATGRISFVVGRQTSAGPLSRQDYDQAPSQEGYSTWEHSGRAVGQNQAYPLKRSQSAVETKILKELDDMKLREEELRRQRTDSPTSMRRPISAMNNGGSATDGNN